MILKNIKREKHRIVSLLIVMLMTLTLLTSIPVYANQENFTYNYDDYTIEYNIVNKWEGFQNIEIKVTNISDKPMYNWAFEYNAGGQIVSIWNGLILSNNGTNYIIKNSGYNYELLPNTSVNFGYTLKSDTSIIPNNFKLVAERVNLTDGYSIKLYIDSEWNTGFNGYIDIVNTSSEPLEAWILSFDTNFIINNLWNATISESMEYCYKVSSQIMSNPIQPGYSVQIGISASVEKDVVPNLTNCFISTVNINVLDFDSNDIGHKDESIIDNSDDIVGKMYFKSISSIDDLIYDIDGGCYARNQILLTVNDNISFETISSVVENINAKIVGYIELTNDYQIEFNEEVSINYLNQIVDELMVSSIIELATLNSTFELTYASDPNDKRIKSKYTSTGIIDIHDDNWNLYAINAFKAWDSYFNAEINETVKLGVIDGYFEEHEDLNFVNPPWNNNGAPKDADHGLKVAGIMAASYNNELGIAGICPNNDLYCFSLLGNDIEGTNKIYSNLFMHKYALAILIGHNVKVINISLGSGGNNLKLEAKSMETFLNKLLMKKYDFVIVQSAGNDIEDARNGSFYACIDNIPVKNHIIVVGAIDHVYIPFSAEHIKDLNGNLALEYVYRWTSNYGDRVDIVAPGDQILSTTLNNTYDYIFATSAATPHVSGVAGLVYSVNPNLTGNEVKDIIISASMNSAVNDPNRLITKTVTSWYQGKYYDYDYKYALLDAKAAVDEAVRRTGASVLPTEKEDAIIYGTVTDINDTPRGKARITITSKDTSEKTIFYTEDDGSYLLTLKAGTYDIKFSVGDGPFGGWLLGLDYAYHTVLNKTIDANDAYPLDVKLDNKSVNSIGVFDSNGKELFDIMISVTNSNSSETYKTTIDSNGFCYDEINNGMYSINLTKNGYIPRVLQVEVIDGVMYHNGKVLDEILLTPIEITITGTVEQYNKTTEETTPVEGLEVTIHPTLESGQTGSEVIGKGTTNTDGT